MDDENSRWMLQHDDTPSDLLRSKLETGSKVFNADILVALTNFEKPKQALEIVPINHPEIPVSKNDGSSARCELQHDQRHAGRG